MKFVAVGLVAVLLSVTGGVAFAQGSHRSCVAKGHACGDGAAALTCCCGDNEAAVAIVGPAQARAAVHVLSTSVVTLIPVIGRLHEPVVTLQRFSQPPPGSWPLDLPIRFSALLI